MEPQELCIVEWTDSDGHEQYELVEATASEIRTIEERMRRSPSFMRLSIVLATRMTMPFDLFDEYVNDVTDFAEDRRTPR